MSTLRPAALALLLLTACQAEPPPPPAGTLPKVVALAAPQTLAAPRTVRAIGRLEAAQEADLGFASAGVVARVDVEIGERVRAGQVLARLDTAALDAGVAQARDQLAQARRDLVRTEGLIGRRLIARQQHDDARTRVDVAAAGLRSAEYAQRYGRIVAAADGVVLARLAEPGEVVAAGSPVLRVAAGGGWLLPVELADREGALVGEGDAAEVELDVLPGRRLPARVARIGGEASARSGALRIELRIDADAALPREIAARLRSGMVGKAWLPLRGESATYVPVSALVEADLDRGVLFVAEPDAAGGLRARRREVRLGALAGSRAGVPSGLVEVTGGLAPGARVVVAGAAYLQDRDPLRLAPPPAVAGAGPVAAPARPVAANR